MRGDLDHGRVLVDGRTQALDRAGQTPYQAGRVNGSAVRCEPAADDVRRAQPLRCLGLREFAVVIVGEPVRVHVLDEFAFALQLHRIAGEVDVATMSEVAVDALGVDHTSDFGHRPCIAVCRRAASERTLLGDGVETHRQQCRAPAAVATTGAEAHHLRFENRNAA